MLAVIYKTWNTYFVETCVRSKIFYSKININISSVTYKNINLYQSALLWKHNKMYTMIWCPTLARKVRIDASRVRGCDVVRFGVGLLGEHLFWHRKARGRRPSARSEAKRWAGIVFFVIYRIVDGEGYWREDFSGKRGHRLSRVMGFHVFDPAYIKRIS